MPPIVIMALSHDLSDYVFRLAGQLLVQQGASMSPKKRTLKAMVDEKLDQALRDSFPASDPVSFIEPAPVKEGDRKLIVVEAAKRMRKRRTTRS